MPESAASACTECGFQNEPAARFCEHCGVKLPLRCPDCGAVVRAEQNFCRGCGRPLREAASGKPRFSTPEHLAERIDSAVSASRGERKIATVLFADIAGSTELIRDLDAEEANRVLGPAVEIMAQVVHRYDGAIREEGDGIMASFGAPLAHEDHAVRACRAALDLQEALRAHAAEVRRDFGLPLQVRVGINSGPVVVQGKLPEFRVDGVPTHVAKRLEALATPGTILLSRDTLTLAEGYVRTGPLETVTVKGVTGPVEVCELHGIVSRMRMHTLAARGLSRFVGRQNEIEQLTRAAALVQSGHGQVVALVGEAGVGKSRVFLEFLRSPAMQGWLVLAASSISYGKATSYLPLVDLLGHYFDIQGNDDERRIREKVSGKLFTMGAEKLLAQMPLFLGALGLGEREEAWVDLSPSERQSQLFDALRRLLIRESQKLPLCVVFEDLHWIDAETQIFLELLMESIPGARVLLLANYRPDYQLQWSGKTYFSQMRVDPLEEESAETLLDTLLGSAAALGPIKRELIRVTDGNPLFLEECVRSLIETGVLAGGPGEWHPVKALPTGFVPLRVEALLAERIDRLQPEIKEVLQCAAVIGSDVPRSLLAGVTDLPPPRLDRSLRELQAAEFLYEKTLFPEQEYTFKHSMTREVAYQGLLRERKAALHARAAHALEALAAGRIDEHVERLADHAERGGLWDKALQYLHRSGAKAYFLYANTEARSFFERALAVLQRFPANHATPGQEVDLLFELRNTLIGHGKTADLLTCLQRIDKCLQKIELASGSVDDKIRRARYASFRCNYHFLVSEQREAIRFGTSGLGFARECEDRPLTGELLYRVAQSHHALGQNREARLLLEESLEFTAERHERGRFGLVVIPAVVNRTWLVSVLVECGDFAPGMQHARKALEIAKSAEHGPSEALARLATGQLLLRKGEFEGAAGALELGLALCDRYQSSLRVWRPRLASTLSIAYGRGGDPARGLALARQAVADAGQLGLAVDRALLLVRLGQSLLISGQVQEALVHGREAAGIAAAHEARMDEAWARFLIARSCWVARPQDLGQCVDELEKTLALARACEARPLVAFCQTMLGAVHGRRGERAAALEHTAAGDALYKELDMRPLPLDPVR